MNILSNLIFLRFINAIKPGNIILLLAFIYLSFLLFELDSIIIDLLFIGFCVFMVMSYFIANKPLTQKERQELWQNDPELVALRKQREEANKKKNPYA